MEGLIKQITTHQYAADAGISVTAACARINRGRHPGIESFVKFNRTFVLNTADDYFEVLNIKKHRKIKRK